MRTLAIETATHGRVLIKDAEVSPSTSLLLVGFHGYAQNSEEMLEELERIPDSSRWTLVSVQALHRFYSRSEKIVASWMTRQDRELAIADNIAYVDRAVSTLLTDAPQRPIVFIGFSQGVAMAYRAAVLGAHQARGVVAIGGDIPPDVKTVPSGRYPAILAAAGKTDYFYTPEKVDADETFLNSLGVEFEFFRYNGGHEWTDELRDRIRRQIEEWMAGL